MSLFSRQQAARCITLLATITLLGLCSGVIVPTPVYSAPPRDTRSDTWVATDAQGRKLPLAGEARAIRPNRTVGIFYFLWQSKRHDPGTVYDISRILASNSAELPWGPPSAFHWWSEPYLGYYYADDPFVIRKHAQMLTDAGVDVIVCDATNAITYPESYLPICRVYEEIRKAGGKTPQIAFILHAHESATAKRLYDEFYGKGLHADLWFRWKGKPLLLVNPKELTPELRDFFTVRESWAWTDPNGWFGDGKDKWPWLDHSPQKPGWHESPERPEQITVAVAQHPTGNIGRSHHDGREPALAEQAPEKGLYFTEQWKRALEADPEFVFVTGWNEWIAQRFLSGDGGGPNFLGKRLNKGETFFVDQYTPEFSRDIEPVRGGFGDSYYYQLVANIRRYKGVRPQAKASAPKTIRIGMSMAQWANVGPEFLDDLGDVAHRNHPGFGGSGPYVNTTGRNDLEAAKVARDSKNLYFYLRTAAPIPPSKSPLSPTEGLTLLLDTDGNRSTGWEGYDFAVRRGVWKGIPVVTLCRNVGGRWEWQPVAPVSYSADGRERQFSVPRAALGLPVGRPIRLDFKWIDNIPESGDIMDFIDKGDAAPNGRFNYRYQE